MLKSLFAAITAFLAMNNAQATSLHPCTPVIQAQPSQLTCPLESGAVSIHIDTLMSDLRICPYDQHVEYHTARIEVIDANGTVTHSFEIRDGDFEYQLGSYFKSEKYGLDLKDCGSPMNGGVSFGN